MNIKKRVYFDNSIYNMLRIAIEYNNTQDITNLNEIKKLVSNGMIEVFLSPANILEIIATQDRQKREQLIKIVKDIAKSYIWTPIEIFIYSLANRLEETNQDFINPNRSKNVYSDSVLFPFHERWNDPIRVLNDEYSNIARDSLSYVKSKTVLNQFRYAILYIRVLKEIVPDWQKIQPGEIDRMAENQEFRTKWMTIWNDIVRQTDYSVLRASLEGFADDHRDIGIVLKRIKDDWIKLELVQELLTKKDYPGVDDLISSVLNANIDIDSFWEIVENNKLLPKPCVGLYIEVSTSVSSVISMLCQHRRPSIDEGDALDWEQLSYIDFVDIFIFRDSFLSLQIGENLEAKMDRARIISFDGKSIGHVNNLKEVLSILT